MWVNNAAYYYLLLHLNKNKPSFLFCTFNFPIHIKMLYLKDMYRSAKVQCDCLYVKTSIILHSKHLM